MPFTSTDFTSKFTDIDGNSLAKIMVNSLPANGLLKLSGGTVSPSQEITVDNIGSLTFNPNSNWYGTTSFGWKGSDGLLYSNNIANVFLNITAVNHAPVVSDIALMVMV